MAWVGAGSWAGRRGENLPPRANLGGRPARPSECRTRGAALDDPTIRDFLELEYPRIVAGLSLLTGSRATAEDAVLEALARAWERSDRGQHIRSLKAWVTVVATNIARSGFRRLMAERRGIERMRAETGGPANSARLGAVEERVDFERLFHALPRRQRHIVVLHYYLDMSVADCARALRITEGAAKNALHRARRSVAAAIGEEADGSEGR